MPVDIDRLSDAIRAAGGEARVAEAAGVARMTVYRAQDPRRREILLDTVERLARATGVPLGELVRERR